ncbi:hypothetical protein LOTGIDRAFT_162012 [Lottia gigantea]|uniref:Ubiquitin-like protease family profile domain-containing protein n=1 Tax=Lottia gigantea TaxID=225164 RepID=V3ZNP1_LOTGI|nr:hypothetical protein LOTGIDRAFT_162012 [Lottia gigantea]ESO92988.1 hypothetical protein LOTGIDRAFT_162012 [Lottia gigantea]
MSLLSLSFRLDNCLKNVNILGVYKPPKTPVANLITAVGNVTRGWKIDDYSLVLGDFNIQLNSKEYVRLNSELNGMEQCIREPTTNAGTTIDFVFSNVPCELNKCGIIENYFSDNKLIYTVIASKNSMAFDTLKLDEHIVIPKRIVEEKKIEFSEQKCAKTISRCKAGKNDRAVSEQKCAKQISKCKAGKNDRAVILSDLICCRGFGYSLKETDLNTLVGKNWLNDQIINFYMKILERDEDLSGTEITMLDTFAYLRIESNMQAAVDMFTDQNLLTYSKILIPIHTPHHWSLVVVYVDSKTIKYYDSVVHKEIGYQCMRKMKDFLLMLESIQPSNWIQIYEKDTTLQLNGYDCGVCTYMNAWLVLGRSLKVMNTELRTVEQELPEKTTASDDERLFSEEMETDTVNEMEILKRELEELKSRVNRIELSIEQILPSHPLKRRKAATSI